MTIEIKQSDSREEVEAKLQQMHDHIAKRRGNQKLLNDLETPDKSKKKDLSRFFGCLKLDIDPLEFQRQIRSEWDEREQKLEELWNKFRKNS